MRRSLKDSAETVAMNRQTLHVGFGGSKVAVYSDAPEVLAGLKRKQEHQEAASNLHWNGLRTQCKRHLKAGK